MDVCSYRVKNFFDVNHWRFSKGYQMVLQFIVEVNQSVVGQKTPSFDQPTTSSSIIDLKALLSSVETDFEDFSNLEGLLKKKFLAWSPGRVLQLRDELCVYFLESFGYEQNDKEIAEFGPGNELKFAIFLAGLHSIDFIKKEDFKDLALHLFPLYLKICQNIIKKLKTKPAKMFSDKLPEDYFVLPYLWGSAQLLGSGVTQMIPDDYLDRLKVEKARHISMFFEALACVYEQNPEPLEDYSPMLYNISQVAKWSKVNSGFLKLYEAEVMRSFPVVRELRFGSLLSFDRIDGAPPLPTVRQSSESRDSTVSH